MLNQPEQHEQHVDTPALRIVTCAECEVWASTCDAQKHALDAAEQDMNNLEREIRKQRRIIAKLNAELAAERKDHPKYTDALDVFHYWVTTLGKNAKTTKFTEQREKAVLKALQHYTKRQLALAILGAKYCAYIGDNGVTHNDLELVCKKVENFIMRYQAYRANRGLPPVNEEEDSSAPSG